MVLKLLKMLALGISMVGYLNYLVNVKKSSLFIAPAV